MAEVASAYVSLLPSAKGFGKGLDRQIGSDLDQSGKTGAKRFGSSFGSTLKSAIGPAIAVIGGAAIGGLLKGAISEASDLGETLNKSRVIFGKNAAAIEQFGDTAAEALGLSKNEAIAAAASFGDMFSQIGFSGKLAASMSKDVVRLAADLGSFNNLETSDVTDRISAAFRGEYDSLQAVIPNINAARVESEALAKTGKKTAKELTAQEKAAAVLAIVHRDGARATGDFARTSDGLANQQKILSAKVTDLKAKIGSALLPVVTKIADYLSDKAVPAFSELVDEMEDGTGTGGKVVDTLKDIWGAAKPIGKTVANIVQAFAALPDSTKKVLLLAGAALLVKNRFGDALPSLKNFDRQAAISAAKGYALRGGAAAAAGALAALSTEAGGASTTVGALLSVGAGTAAGFAVAGPWGAAIGGSIALLSTFKSRSQASADAQAYLKEKAQGVATTLNEQNGALTKNTRLTAAKALADTGAFTAAKKVGVSYRDVLDASLGNEAATKRVDKATRNYLITQGTNFDTTRKAAKVAGTLTEAVHGTSGAIADQRNKITQVNTAMGKLDGKKATVHVQATGIGGVLAGVASIGAALDRAIKKAGKVKVGANAKGTDNWRGGLTWVGEEGPELINLAKGAQVIPNHKIGDVSSHRSSSASVVPTIEQKIYPQPGQSEDEIGRAAANRLLWAMAG